MRDWHISYPVLGIILSVVLGLCVWLWWCNRSKQRTEDANRIIRDDIMNMTFIPLEQDPDLGINLGLGLDPETCIDDNSHL